jgi:hypothetical protein
VRPLRYGRQDYSFEAAVKFPALCVLKVDRSANKIPTILGVWWGANQRVLRGTRLINQVPRPSASSFFV